MCLINRSNLQKSNDFIDNLKFYATAFLLFKSRVFVLFIFHRLTDEKKGKYVKWEKNNSVQLYKIYYIQYRFGGQWLIFHPAYKGSDARILDARRYRQHRLDDSCECYGSLDKKDVLY